MLAIAGIALVGVGYAGLKQANNTQRSLVPEPLPPRQTFAVTAATTDAFTATSVQQTGLNAGFPAQPPPNGLNKDRFLDLDRGMSGTILERHTGIPIVPSRKHDPPAPYKPTPNLRPTGGDTARADQMKLYTGAMSQYRNDEVPIPRTQVGPGVGYDASVPAADGFHPRLRIVSTDALTQRSPLRSLPPTAPNHPVSRREADVHISQNSTTRTFEKSVEYTTGNPSASSAGTSSGQAPRANYEPIMKPTMRDTEMPALKAASKCNDIDAETSRFGIGAGPAIASGSVARVAHSTYSGSESRAAVDAMRTTDRGWSGLWGVGPSAASDVPSAGSSDRTRWQSAIRAQSRDATGLDPERIGQGGPSNAVGGATTAWQDTPATQGRELMPALPVINTAPSDVSGVMHSPWTDTTAVARREDSHVRAPNRASYALNDHDLMPTAQVTGSSSERQRSAFAQGRLGRATHREVIDREQFATTAPHSGIGDMVRPKWQTFALRDATSDAFRVSGPNRGSSFESSDFAKGHLAPNWQLATPKPDFMNERMPNTDQRGGMAYKPPTGVQYNPNKFETPDDRLDVAVDSQVRIWTQ